MRGWRAVGALLVALVAAALAGMLMAVTLTRIVATLHAQERDAVFVGLPTCRTGVVPCAREVYFNGDWMGVRLCHTHECHPFETVFKENR